MRGLAGAERSKLIGGFARAWWRGLLKFVAWRSRTPAHRAPRGPLQASRISVPVGVTRVTGCEIVSVPRRRLLVIVQVVSAVTWLSFRVFPVPAPADPQSMVMA